MDKSQSCRTPANRTVAQLKQELRDVLKQTGSKAMLIERIEKRTPD